MQIIRLALIVFAVGITACHSIIPTNADTYSNGLCIVGGKTWIQVEAESESNEYLHCGSIKHYDGEEYVCYRRDHHVGRHHFHKGDRCIAVWGW